MTASLRTLPRGPYALPPDEARALQRARLLEAVIGCVARKGYTATSVADILEEAGISRATFYALFTDKEDCFLAAYAESTRELEHTLASALHSCGTDATDPADRLRVLLHTWLTALSERPAAAKALLVDIQAAGPAANTFRQAAIERFIAQTTGVLALTSASLPRGSAEDTESHADPAFLVRVMMHGALSMATALILTGRQAELPGLEAPLVALFRSQLQAAIASTSPGD